jgi:uncharacterized protein (DUF433 family)
MGRDYVVSESGAYRIAGTPVSLDSVVYGWLEGLFPEAIVDSFPLLKLEEVLGALAFYLEHKKEVEDYLRQGEAEFEALRARTNRELKEKKPLLHQKLMEHKNRNPITSGSRSFRRIHIRAT